jgi:hypothetical protein
VPTHLRPYLLNTLRLKAFLADGLLGKDDLQSGDDVAF